MKKFALPIHIKSIISVALYSLNGRKVYSSSTEYADYHYINIDQLNAGVYVIIMKLKDGRYREERIVVK